MHMKLALVVLEYQRSLAFIQAWTPSTAVEMQGNNIPYATGRSIFFLDATIPAMNFPEIVFTLHDNF